MNPTAVAIRIGGDPRFGDLGAAALRRLRLFPGIPDDW